MASSPAVVGDELVVHGDGRQRLRARPRATARLRWQLPRSARRSSPRRSCANGIDYFGAWNGDVYALDLKTRRAALDAPRRLQDHLERRARGRHALHRRLRRPRCSRSRRAPGASRWSRLGERAHLRHAGGRGGARLRPLLDGRLADGVLDPRPLPLARRTGSYVYSSPAVWAGASSSAPTTACSTAVSARSGRVALARRRRRPGLRRRGRRRRRRLRGPRAAASIGADARTGRVRLPLPARRVRAGLGQRARLLLHGYSRLYAVAKRRPMKKAARGARPPCCCSRPARCRLRTSTASTRAATSAAPRRSSSSTTDVPEPKPAVSAQEIRWPMYGYDARRLRRLAVQMPSSRPSCALWRSAPAPARVPAGGRATAALYFANNSAGRSSPSARDGQARLALPVPPLRGRLAGASRRHRLHGVPEPAALQRASGKPG